MIKAENDITLVRVDDGEGGKSAYASAQDGGYTGTEEQFNTDLAEVPNKADTADVEELVSNVNIIGETVTGLHSDVTGIENNVDSLNTSVSDLGTRADELENQASRELVAKGYARITDEPSLELGRNASDWKVKVTNQSIDLSKDGSSGAKLSPNPERVNETLFRTDSARLANLYFRSADGKGKLGIVAQSNGHISLKEA